MQSRNDFSSIGSNNDGVLLVGRYEQGWSSLQSYCKTDSDLEKLLSDAEYDYTDAEIIVEGISVKVNRCILALRSQFFHGLFKTGRDKSMQEAKPKYILSELVPRAKFGYESFMIILNYLYAGKLKPPPTEVATCVDDSCAHDACGPAIAYAVELMYAAATFQIKQVVEIVQRQLLNFVARAFVEDIIPIVLVAFHCELNKLLSQSSNRIVLSNLDDSTLEKELPHEIYSDIKSLRQKFQQAIDPKSIEVDSLHFKRKRIYMAMDFHDVQILKSVVNDPDMTLNDACALHYAAAYCDPKFVNEVLSLSKVHLNLRNSLGYTALHIAARRKDLLLITVLLKNGASVSQITTDGRTAITICRRMTRLKDFNDREKEKQEINNHRLCIHLLERWKDRNPLGGIWSMSSAMVAGNPLDRVMHRNSVAGTMLFSSETLADDLCMRLLFLENIVALARVLFPLEAKIAMEIADADRTSVFKAVEMIKTPHQREIRLRSRLKAMQSIVEKGQRLFPGCCKVVDKFLEDDVQIEFFLEKCTPEEEKIKKVRFLELKEKVREAFDEGKDSRESNFSFSSCEESDTLLLERARMLLQGDEGKRKMQYKEIEEMIKRFDSDSPTSSSCCSISPLGAWHEE